MKLLVCRMYDSHERHYVWALVAMWGVSTYPTWQEAMDDAHRTIAFVQADGGLGS